MPFRREDNHSKPKGRNLRVNNITTVEKIDSLTEELRSILRYYSDIPKVINNLLIEKCIYSLQIF